MRHLVFICFALGCGDHSPTTCSNVFPADETDPFDIGIEIPISATAPIGTDLVVRGTVGSHAEDVTRIYVDGIPVTHDGPDLSTFDVTVPFAILQNEASAQASLTQTSLDVRVITNCGDDPVQVQVPDATITLRVVTSLTFTGQAPDAIPSTTSVPAMFNLTANQEAIGTPLTLTASQGTVIGPTVITNTAMTIKLVGDPTKQGTAEITAQAGGKSDTSSVLVVGPPTFAPASGAIKADGASVEVAVMTKATDNVINCAASGSTGFTASADDKPFDGLGLTAIMQTVGPNHFFTIETAGAMAKGSITITCLDSFGQASTVTFTVPG